MPHYKSLPAAMKRMNSKYKCIYQVKKIYIGQQALLFPLNPLHMWSTLNPVEDDKMQGHILVSADHSSTNCSMKNHFEVSLHTHQSSRFHVNGKRSFDGNDQDLAEIACAYLLSTQSKRCEVLSNETLPCKSFGSKKSSILQSHRKKCNGTSVIKQHI